MADVPLVTQGERRAAACEVAPIEGLCRTCLQAEECTFPRDPSRPIWSCDEFAGSGPRVPPRQRAPVRPVVQQTGEATEIKGLCRVCANRPTCTYPKPLGGVWHCEELA